MKTSVTFIAVAIVVILCVSLSRSLQAGGEIKAASEYVTLRWAGRDNTHVIRANGEVEALGSKFKNIKKPDRADDRSFFMNLAMNALAREGYEFVAMTPDDYVFRRTVSRDTR